MFTIIAVISFSLCLVLAILLVCGLPLGEFTMGGGQPKVLPYKMRIVVLGCIVIQIFCICMILQTGGYMSLWFSPKATKYICIAIAIYLTINSVMNFLSRSRKEKYFITPLSTIAAICTYITAFGMKFE